VVQEAHVMLHTGSGETDAGSPVLDGPGGLLDSVQRLLSVAGWPAAAATARRLRDHLADGAPGEAMSREYRRWSRQVRRSRLLRWSTDSLGVLGEDAPPEIRGDATVRWRRWLDDVDAALTSQRTPGRDAAAAARSTLEALPRLLLGQEFAAARLIVASLDPDIDALVDSREPEPAHG
jgi:hypothetical protein